MSVVAPSAASNILDSDWEICVIGQSKRGGLSSRLHIHRGMSAVKRGPDSHHEKFPARPFRPEKSPLLIRFQITRTACRKTTDCEHSRAAAHLRWFGQMTR